MGADEAVLAYVTSANVACGFHAGDPPVIDRTVALAVRAGVAVGAHPGHFDLRGFGRREIAADPAEVEADVLYQVGALAAFARAHGAPLTHVKPHGALYNQAARDEALARAIARGGRALRPRPRARRPRRLRRDAAGRRGRGPALRGRGLRRPRLRRATAGSSRARSPGALITDPASAAAKARAHRARRRRDVSIDGAPGRAGRRHPVPARRQPRTSLAIARAVREALEGAGVSVQALAR